MIASTLFKLGQILVNDADSVLLTITYYVEMPYQLAANQNQITTFTKPLYADANQFIILCFIKVL